ncbi:MAG TPA: GTP cyclohydrolase II, partial [Polymorphobacter sp.]|nr:GTP cyclohydrolase II [Polymorphobacter sp.]
MSALESAGAQQVARAVDELRRGQPVTLTSAAGALTVLAVELADTASLTALDAPVRADLLIARPRAALLHIINQRAAEGTGVVRIARASWMDLAASVAIADPVRDLDSPFKGPFRALELGDHSAAAAAAIR